MRNDAPQGMAGEAMSASVSRMNRQDKGGCVTNRPLTLSCAVHSRRASRPRNRRDAQETAGRSFRGSIQASQDRGNGNERGEAFVRFLHPDPCARSEPLRHPQTPRTRHSGSLPFLDSPPGAPGSRWRRLSRLHSGSFAPQDQPREKGKSFVRFLQPDLSSVNQLQAVPACLSKIVS